MFGSLLVAFAAALTSSITTHAAAWIDPSLSTNGTVTQATQALSFKWTSSGPLIYPKNDGQGVYALKDPSIIFYNGAYHVFTSVFTDAYGYNVRP